MHLASLTALRVAFAVLGVALLTPLFFLSRSVEERLEAQRRLRHEIVAERIFDEMEGELTALLRAERARPSSAYDTTQTRVDSWAPFVVGYFTHDGQLLHLPARGQLGETRAARVEGAALAVLPKLQPPPPSKVAIEVVPEKDLKQELEPLLEQAPQPSQQLEPPSERSRAEPRTAKVDNRQDAVLRQLNRAAKKRDQPKPSPKRRRVRQQSDDPLSGLDDFDPLESAF